MSKNESTTSVPGVASETSCSNVSKLALAEDKSGLDSGFPHLNRAINGLPREACFISISGKSNHGPSTFLDNLTLAHEQRCTVLMTANLPEDCLSPGTRASIGHIRGTSGPACGANANFTLVWHDPQCHDDITSPSSEGTQADRRLPIVELVIDKTSIFFHLNPISGRITECSEGEQAAYRLKSHE